MSVAEKRHTLITFITRTSLICFNANSKFTIQICSVPRGLHLLGNDITVSRHMVIQQIKEFIRSMNLNVFPTLPHEVFDFDQKHILDSGSREKEKGIMDLFTFFTSIDHLHLNSGRPR